MEEDQVYQRRRPSPSFPSPTIWLTKFISLQTDIFVNCLLAFLSPLFSILSLLSVSPKQSKENDEFAASHTAAGGEVLSSKVRNGIVQLIKKVGLGILGAAYVGTILTLLLVVSFVIGFGLVNYWVEEPLNLRERLHFDYSLVNPEAILSFNDDVYSFNGVGLKEYGYYSYRKVEEVPVGHTYYVSVLLLLPESDYNREVGVFQLNAELMTSDGVIIGKTTRPCMLYFRSLPVRLMRTFAMAIPLVLGIKSETQTIIIPMIKHKEGFPRTDSIRITMVSRPGTNYIPQMYEAHIILRSKPTWRKEFLRNWRWTFSIWTSFCMYTMVLLVLLLSSFRHVLLPVMARDFGNYRVKIEEEVRTNGALSLSELLKKWEENRKKRKERLEVWDIDEVVEYVGYSSISPSPSSSISLMRGEDDDSGNKSTLEEEVGDSESVCL